MSEECRCEEYQRRLRWYQDRLFGEARWNYELIMKIDAMTVEKYPELALTAEQEKEYPSTAKARKEFAKEFGAQ
jgi:hypothetical protein